MPLKRTPRHDLQGSILAPIFFENHWLAPAFWGPVLMNISSMWRYTVTIWYLYTTNVPLSSSIYAFVYSNVCWSSWNRGIGKTWVVLRCLTQSHSLPAAAALQKRCFDFLFGYQTEPQKYCKPPFRRSNYCKCRVPNTYPSPMDTVKIKTIDVGPGESMNQNASAKWNS